MAETCLLAEYAICYPPLYNDLKSVQPRPTETVETVAIAAVAAASEQNAGGILVLSTSGNTARLISKYRPRVPIITGVYTFSEFCLLTLIMSVKSLATSRLLARFICIVDVIHSGTLSQEVFRSTNGKPM